MTDTAPSINEEAARLRSLKEERDESKAIYDEADKAFKSAQIKLMERMDEEKCEGIKQGGINFIPTKTIYGQVQDRAAFVEWAKENAPELVEEKEIGERINELARQLLDDGEPFPPGLNFRTKEYISQRAVSKK